MQGSAKWIDSGVSDSALFSLKDWDFAALGNAVDSDATHHVCSAAHHNSRLLMMNGSSLRVMLSLSLEIRLISPWSSSMLSFAWKMLWERLEFLRDLLPWRPWVKAIVRPFRFRAGNSRSSVHYFHPQLEYLEEKVASTVGTTSDLTSSVNPAAYGGTITITGTVTQQSG